MGRLLGALQTLGAARQRDGSLLLDVGHLELTSLFGGPLIGTAGCSVVGDALAFKTPPELAACGRLWLPDIGNDDALVQAIADAHGELRARVNDAFASLRRLGFKARLQAPEPRARGSMQIDGVAVVVAIEASGDLVVESVDGRHVGSDQRRSLAAPEEATPAEALALLGDVVRAVQRRQPPAMLQNELDEPQAALSDSDNLLSSSEEGEPTAADVPMPARQTRPIPSDFDDGSTLQLAVSPSNDFTHELGDADDESDIGTLKVRFDAGDVKAALAGRAAPAPAAKDRSLLNVFDDDGEAPVAAAALSRQVDVDVDFDSDEADGFADSPEPTAKRPRVGGVATVAIGTRQARAADEEEDDLLAALGDEDDDDEVPPPVDAIASFPGLDVDGPGFLRGATSLNVADQVSASASPTTAAMPPSTAVPMSATPRPASTSPRPAPADNFDDDPTRGVGLDSGADEFDDGKTRALVVDAALLARLKLGDAQAEPPSTTGQIVVTAAPPPMMSLLDDELGALPALPVGASHETDGFTPPASRLEAQRTLGFVAEAKFLKGERGTLAADAASIVDTAPMRADNDGGLASLPDDEPALDPRTAPLHVIENDNDDNRALEALLAQEAALVCDLNDVRAQIVTLRASREFTDHAAVAARLSQAPTVMPAKRLTLPSTPSTPSSKSSSSSSSSRSLPQPAAPRSADQFAVVGASDERSAEAETNAARGIASLPSMKSIDVHEILPPPKPQNHLRDALDGFDDDDDGDDGDDGDDHRSAAAAARQDDNDDNNDNNDNNDDVVSRAALQGALQEMGVDLDSGQTQVAASMPFALPADNDDDGDVFGSNARCGGLDQPTPDPSVAASELSHEATRVRQARPASIGIVVEDERARLRLRKHLVDRFAELFEAEDCAAAVQLKELSHLDAIVFVRPTDNEPTRAGFARLNDLPRRPRILVISGNERFDELPAVDLRLPLGLKASEVARQVLEGLERLGIQSAPGP